MILKIKEQAAPVKRITNSYELIMNFMEGDADGDQTRKVRVKTEDYNSNEDVQRIFHDLINVVEGCNNAYPHGRGGYDEYNAVPGYNKWFSEDYPDDVTEEEMEKISKEFEEHWDIFNKYFTSDYWDGIEHPSDSNYISTTFRGWSVLYYDENGDIFPVEVVFSAEEKEYHNQCKLIK